MISRLISIFIAGAFLSFQLFVGNACAVELDEGTRTVPLNVQGDNYVLSLKEVQKGKRLFNDTCAQCHAGGVTKTNQNVGLDPETLALAT
ncbi:MAG: c-type cytochrome, partial [Cyanobacteria bacterium P01_C01_bin.38]